MIRFTEKQSVGQNPFTWAILAPVMILSTWGLYANYLTKESLDPTNQTIALLSAGGLAILLLSLLISLTTEVDEKGIHIFLRPGVKKFIKWNEITSAYITRYDKLYEFGNTSYVGVAHGRSGLKGYFISGDVGLMVITGSEKILIGTKKPKKLLAVVQEYKK